MLSVALKVMIGRKNRRSHSLSHGTNEQLNRCAGQAVASTEIEESRRFFVILAHQLEIVECRQARTQQIKI